MDDNQTIAINKELVTSRCLNLCELKLILADQMKLSTRRNQAALTLIKQAYEYSAKFAQVSNRQAIFDLRTALESRGVLEEFEMALLVNLMPRSPDEAKILIPTLNKMTDDMLGRILKDIEEYRMMNM